MKIHAGMLAGVVVVLLGHDAWAGPFGFRRGVQSSRTPRPATQVQQVQARPDLGTAQGVANYLARIGRIGHFGGNPYPAEGVGMGATADQAIRNCCFYGRRRIADQGVAQGAGGWWFACCRYW